MKENKVPLIILGCVSILCLCLAFSFTALSGFYAYEKLKPLKSILPTTRETSQQNANNPLENLERIQVMTINYAENDTEIYDGVAVYISYYDAHDELIRFEDLPIQATIEIYAFRDFLGSTEISNGEKIYQEIFDLDHSPTLDELFDSYIRIPYEEINADPAKFISLGMISITVETPAGNFSDTSSLVTLYPEEE